MRRHFRVRPLTKSEKKARAKTRDDKYYILNKDKIKLKSIKRREMNPEQAAINSRNNYYVYRYGFTREEAKLMIINQDNKCAICKTTIEIDGAAGAHIDHCHNSNKIRGILCNNCNHGLGHFKDNTTILLNAINYLKKRKFILLVDPTEKIAS